MKLSLNRGMTINLGNHESARFDISIEETFDGIPLSEAYGLLAKKVGELEQNEIARIKRELKR